MDNAGRAVSDIVSHDIGDRFAGDIDIFCGKGNNGGDGLVAAKYLSERYPGQVFVYLDGQASFRRSSAMTDLEILARLAVPVLDLSDFSIQASNDLDVYIDAVFGIGFHGELPGALERMFVSINSSGNEQRYSVDVPSGLNADTGVASAGTFTANKTITFGLPKKGFYMADGPSRTGTVITKNIGFPPSLLRKYSAKP
jgi:NAD(P)H-hydrate epimerase